ncbi:MAG: CcmD family protein [Nitrolancea sp.]
MSNLSYLFIAFLITWIVIAGYLWMLGRQVQNLKDEVELLTEGTEFGVDVPERTGRADLDSPAIGSRQS